VRTLRGVLDQLHVAYGHARLYGGGHAETARALALAAKDLETLLAHTGPVELRTASGGLYWSGELVRPEADDVNGLGSLLHREGIAGLTLEPGITPDELARLVDLLRTNLSLAIYEEETLESLLWQEGLKHVGVEGVAELMEAEALSGRAADGEDGSTIEPLAALLGFSGALGDRPVLSDDPGAPDADGDAVAAGSEGGSAPGSSRGAVELMDGAESGPLDGVDDILEPGDVATRLFYLLLRLAVADRPELPLARALELADRVAADLAERNDYHGLDRLVGDRHRFLGDPEVTSSGSFPAVVGFIGRAYEPGRIVKTVLAVDPAAEPDVKALSSLVQRLPDPAVWSMIDAVQASPPSPRRDLLTAVLCEAGAPRIRRWLAAATSLRPSRILALLALTAGAGDGLPPETAEGLLHHPDARVRAAALRSYGNVLPRAATPVVLGLLLDHSRLVRGAAADLLAVGMPSGAPQWFEANLARAPALDAKARRDLCVACGRILGDDAFELLSPLLQARSGVFGRDADAETTLSAAAHGLAAAGSVRALQALRKGAAGWNRARKAACVEALRTVEGGDP